MPLDISDVLKVEVAWSDGPWATTPTFTDITADVYEARWGWSGHPHGGDAESSDGELLLRNNDATYDDVNSSSPYTGQIRKNRLVRISGSDDSFVTEQVLYTGYLRDLRTSNDSEVGSNTARMKLTDGIGIVALFPPEDIEVGVQFGGARIDDILDAIGWPAAKKSIGDGTVRQRATTITSGALAYCNEIVAGECGYFWCDMDGVLRFVDRFGQLDTTNWPGWGTNQATLTDTVLKAAPVVTGLHEFEAVERVTAAASSGTTQVHENLTADFPPDSKHRTMSEAFFDADAEQTARRVQEGFEYTGQRPGLLTYQVYPSGSTTMLTHIVDRDIDAFNRVSQAWTPRGSADTLTFDGTIVGWQHRVSYDEGWQMGLALAPYDSTWRTAADDFYELGTNIGTGEVPGY